MPNSLTSEYDRRWLILAVLSVAQLMVVLDATVVNIALPSAQQALHFSDSSRQWVITAYTLAFGSLLLLGGRLADLFGRKRTLITGLAGFAVASAVGGTAQSFDALIAARAVQGMFAALLAPAALSLLTTTFTEPRERGKAFGIFGAIAGAGAGIGLILGGVLTEYLSWRWCLYVNLIFAAVAGTGALLLLAKHARTAKPHLDIPGTLTASAGLFALVYGFSEADRSGWSASSTLGFLAAGIVLLVVFVVIERRAAHPLLPLRIVLHRNRGGSYLAMLIASMGMFGVFLFLTYYLQQTLGYSPVKSGLAFLPMIAAVVATSTTASTVLLPRVGPRLLVLSGMLFAAAGMVVLAQLGVHSTYTAHVLPALIPLGLGLGLIFAPAMNTATFGVDPGDAGVASATVNTAQQVGGSLGTALLNTVATTATTAFVAGTAASPAIAAEATVHGYVTAFWWAAAIFAAGAVICGLLLRPGSPQRDPRLSSSPRETSPDQETKEKAMPGPSTQDPARPAIAVLGTGRMGAPIAHNLLSAGFEVSVWDRSAERAAALVSDGARLASSPAEAAEGVGVVLTMLTDGEVVGGAMLGRDGALGSLPPGSVWIQMATIGEEWTERLATVARVHRLEFVDAPVSGSDGPAREGELVVLASGPDGVRASVQPIFDAIGRKTLWLGPAGDGTRLKLVLNNWLVSQVEAVAETIALTEALGLDPRLFMETIGDGPLGSPYAMVKARAMIDGDFTPGFALQLAYKDVGLALDAAREHDLELPITEALLPRWEEAIADGHAGDDLSAVIVAASPRARVQ